MPSGFGYDVERDTIELHGFELERTKKFRDVHRSRRAAVVIDDLRSIEPWRPRGIEVRGAAEAVREPRAAIRVHAERIVSWGIESEEVGRRSARSVRKEAPAPQGIPPEVDVAGTALLVIDMQRGFLEPGSPLQAPGGGQVLGVLERVIAGCRARGVPVLYTQHVHRRDGSDMGLLGAVYEQLAVAEPLLEGTPSVAIDPRIAPEPGEIVIAKHRFSGFHATDLELVLRGMGIETLVLTGVTTENCIQATARDAGFRDLQTIVISDACAAAAYPDTGFGAMPARETHRVALALLAGSGSATMTGDEFLTAISKEHP